MTRSWRSGSALGVLLTLLSSIALAAPPPGLMSYQGVLRNGTTLLDGPQNLVFRFYSAEVGGVALLVDSHTSVSGGQVTASQGTFNVLLGGGVVSDGPGPGTLTGLQDLFTAFGDVYLETEVNGEVLAPRVRIASVAFSLNSHTLDGQGASAFVPSATNTAFALKTVRQGATLIWESAASVRVMSGILGFSDGKVRESVADQIWSFANGVGPLGLDAGVEAPNTFYYLYAVPDPLNDSRFTVVASITAPPQVGEAGPAGYATFRFLGSVKNDASANIILFTRTGGFVRFQGEVGDWRAFQGSETTIGTLVTVSTSGFQPKTSRSIITTFYYDAWGGSTGLLYYVTPGTGAGATYLQKLCADWGDGTALGQAVIGTINGQFSWRADIFVNFNNGALQTRAFSYAGYSEELTEY